MTDPDTASFDPAAEAEAAGRMGQRKRLFKILAVGVLAVAILVFLWQWLIASRTVSTDNAYVGGDVAIVTPLISAPVASVEVVDTQPVRKGQVLVRLVDDDMRMTLAKAQADLALAQRNFRRTIATGGALEATVAARDADIESARAQLAAATSAVRKAQIDFDRRNTLAKSGAVSGDELTVAINALAAAKADQMQAQARVEQARASRRSAEEDKNANLELTRGTNVDNSPEVAAARARLAEAELNMARTVIRAPIDGIVTRRQVQTGQRVSAGAALMTIVPVDQLYVDANFKENQLAKVRTGQPVEVTSLLYGGDVVYHGKVAGLAGGTGAAFALIPAQNATGNWVRVTQRVPVRIILDPKQLHDHPLRIGLSMEAKIRVDR